MKQQPKKEKKIKKLSSINKVKKLQQEPHEEPAISKPKKARLEHLPTIQNMLEIPEPDRAARTTEYFKQVKPFLVNFMQKKVGSRVLQLMFKWGGKDVQNALQQCALKNWKELVKSKYSLYIIEKVSKQFQLPGVVEDAVLLQGSKQGARIIQNYINSNPESEGAHRIKDTFYGLNQKSKQGDLKAQQTLHNLSLKAIEKGYEGLAISKLIIRLALPTMFAEEKEKVVQFLTGKVAQFVGDEEGVRLFIELLNNCGAKQKKIIVKTYKGNISEIVSLNNNAYVTVMKLLTEVDDTVLIQKNLLTEIQQLYPLINSNKKAFSIIFSLFSPRNHNFNVLGKYEHMVNYTQCKKPEEQRKKQLREHLYDTLIAFLRNPEELDRLARHHINNKLILGIYKSLQNDSLAKQYKEFISSVANHFLQDTKRAVKDNTFEGSLIANASANKVIKNILTLNEEFVDYYCDQFGKLLVKSLPKVLLTKASFVFLALIEKGGRNHLLGEIKRANVKLDKAVAGEHYLNLLRQKN